MTLPADLLATLRADDAAHHLHPFTHHPQMRAAGTHVIVGGDGCYVIDQAGRRLFDGIAGLWCVNVGYSCTPIVEAVTEQMRKLPYYCSFFNSTTQPAIELAGVLGRLAPPGLGQVFFVNSGSEANETALKLVRAYWVAKGQPDRMAVIARKYAYHGVGLASTSLTGLESCLTPFNLPLPGFLHAPAPHRYDDPDPQRRAMSREGYGRWCLDQTRQLIEATGPDKVGAIFAEPVQGAGGVIPPPPGYLAGLRNLAREYGTLFVADEVITAYGRMGCWFASSAECYDLRPDIMCTAKGLTSGYLPLGAVFVRDSLVETLNSVGYLAHGFTYSGHPAACAAALANLSVITEQKLPQYVRDTIGPAFQQRLAALDGHPAVGETRGVGLLGAIEITDPHGRVPAGAARGPWVAERCREKGVIVRGIRNLIAMSPPLIVTEPQVDELFAVVRSVLDDVA